MSRLWKLALALGFFGAAAFIDSVRVTRSMWPAVALFCLAGILACIAAAVDSVEAERRWEEQEDSHAALEAHKKQSSEELAKVVAVVNNHAADIDYLKKRNVYGDTLGG